MARLIALLLSASILTSIGGYNLWASDEKSSTGWSVSEIDASTLPPEIVPERRDAAVGGLPDGLISTFDGAGDVRTAWYASPTTRYRHAILGDGIEAGTLVVEMRDGQKLRLTLPQDQVFEDRYPRLADLEGDGKVEIITHLSSHAGGGSVAVFGVRDQQLQQIGSSGFIGRANRWQNVAGIADFRGTGSQQIAYVETPHIGGTLYFLEMHQGALRRVASLYGFSNHEIGSREMRLSAIADVDGDGRPDLALPSADRHDLRIVGFDSKGELREIASIRLPAAIDKAVAISGLGIAPKFTVGTADRRAFVIERAN